MTIHSNSFRDTKRTQSDGTTIIDVELVNPQPNFIYYITSVSAVDRTTTLTSIEILAGSFGNEIELDRTANPTVEERVTYNRPLIIIENGERLIARFTGSTNNDDLVCNWVGYYRRVHDAH